MVREVGMRAPRRRRPMKRTMYVPTNTDLDSLSENVHYVGSPEHKDIPSFAGQPRLRADASCCPRSIESMRISLSKTL